MSGPIRQRVLRSDAFQCVHSVPPPSLPIIHRRTFLSFFGRSKTKESSTQNARNPFLAELLSRKNPKQRPPIEKGDLSADSPFSTNDDVRPPDALEDNPDDIEPKNEVFIQGQRRNLAEMRVVLDPAPRSRELWQRNKVIQSIRKRERLTHDQFLKRTERELTERSHNFKTSVKKLGMLARQIQGKTVDEAILQMRFSKKKMAKEVKKHLEFARDKAIVSRGMGLQSIGGLENEEPVKDRPVDIETKDGKRYTVEDRSKIYVDQAWVGRGPFGKEPDYRARGRIYTMRPPWTHLSVKLKEESTRVREWQEKEEKRRKQRLDKVWVPLPDRAIYGQNQYYTW
ncbi:54S ribosomal protein L22, mitochondrial [Sphaceloma murrayae]|uniref:54S ribosomal protein L22, mitochondrial n=1 Tax=Sphaceloma murrayae TaxID=2082308 RepID=A0A2K1QT96_9PEZI|nr:54S ribosomal protein L22, mitochondrial [Sphaceloma murrayae]